jgi:hypothetical protein
MKLLQQSHIIEGQKWTCKYRVFYNSKYTLLESLHITIVTIPSTQNTYRPIGQKCQIIYNGKPIRITADGLAETQASMDRCFSGPKRK